VEDCVASAWRRGRGAWAALRAEILLTCNKRHKAVAQAERKMWVERVFYTLRVVYSCSRTQNQTHKTTPWQSANIKVQRHREA
jgi:phenylalanyl-tRNA synthetase beta subunit